MALRGRSSVRLGRPAVAAIGQRQDPLRNYREEFAVACKPIAANGEGDHWAVIDSYVCPRQPEQMDSVA